jgi:threonine-phosphate decarboxylase
MGAIDFSHGGNIYAVKEKYGRDVIDFSASINPLGLPKGVRLVLSRARESIIHYPDPDARSLTKAIAGYLGIRRENILAGNGSIELIYLIARAVKPRTTAIAIPAFSEYERAVRCENSKIDFIKLKEEKNFMPDTLCPRRQDLLFLCNPNNPTGNLIMRDPAAIKRLKSGMVVVDESFMDFLDDERKYTLLKEAAHSRNIIVLRTFTKFFALAGLRIGYLVAHKEIIRKLKAYRISWSVNALSQEAAVAALRDKNYINRTRLLVEKERRFLLKGLNAIEGLRPYPSVANFILVRIEKGRLSAAELKEKLIRRGILIRDCANFRGLNNKYFRIAVRSRAENLKLLAALRQVV